MSNRRKNRPSGGKSVRRDAATDQLIKAGFELHQYGRLDEASRHYEQALAGAPDDPDALHLLGALNLQRDRPREAVELIERALAVTPKNADYLNNLGNAYVALEQPAEAADAFRKATKQRSDFAQAFISLGSTLGQLGEHEEALTALRRAIDLDPTSVDARCNRGVSLQALERVDEAIDAFSGALKVDPTHAPSLQNMALALEHEESRRFARRGEVLKLLAAANAGLPDSEQRDLGYLYRTLVPRWHFPMLNDDPRNAAFEAAIQSAVKPGSVVLDIGTGSGLLAMMAARAGAKHVYACEMIAPLADRARAIVARNHLQDRITILAKRSTDLKLGVDLPEAATVLVTETVDVGLLGEATLPSIEHARRELLVPDATIIPCGATVHGMLIESAAIRALDQVGEVRGFDLSDFNQFSSTPRYFQAGMRHHPYRQLSAVFDVFAFDFRQGSPGERTLELNVPVTEVGRFDAVAFWFSLHLNETISLDTGPFEQDSHWDQAVVVPAKAQSVQRLDTVHLLARHDDTSIELAVVND